MLSVAAVIGRRFDLDLLAAVVDQPVAEVLGRLEPALDEGLVEVDEQAPGRLVFAHALVSSTLAAELNAARLAAHHARITDAIEELRADDLEPWVEELAHHAAEGLLAGTGSQGRHLRTAGGGDRRRRPVVGRRRAPAPAGAGRRRARSRIPRPGPPRARAPARRRVARLW